MKITIEGKVPSDPRQRVLAVEGVVESLCRSVGEDPADGTMTLLTAAAHMARKYARPGSRIETVLAESLGAAIAAADGFFSLRAVTPDTQPPENLG